MAIIHGTFLLISGTLILSENGPVRITKPHQEVWFSSQSCLEVKPIQQSLLLNPKKTCALNSSLQIGDKQQASPQKILIVSRENFKALAKCPTQDLDLSVHPPKAQEWSNKQMEWLSRCGFEDLQLSPESQHYFQKNVEHVEKDVFTEHSGVRAIQWEQGQRKIDLTAGSQEDFLLLKKRVYQQLGPWAPFYKFSYLPSAKPGRTLLFRLTLFEFSKSKAQALGAVWPIQVRLFPLEGSVPKQVDSSGKQAPVNIGADFGEQSGLGRILAQPKIRTKPGEKASFHTGGEMPIKTSNGRQQNTTWKNYGLIVNLEPDSSVLTGHPEISLKFQVELSEPDNGLSVDGVPGMKVRRLESRFDLRTNVETILTSMISSRLGNSSQGILGFSKIPILGRLFGSENEHEHNSELWFSIYPSWNESL